MTESLRDLLGRFDLEHAAPITAAEARRWGREFVERVIALGVLREATPAARLRNETCEHGCDMEPEIITHATTGERFGVHRCLREECGLVRIPLDDLRRWEFNLSGAAEAIASAISAGGQVTVDVPGRLVEVGRIVSGDTWRDVFLARGLAWSDAATALADARRPKASRAPLVLALAELPRADVWSDCHPAVTLLSDVASFEDAELAMDLSGVIGRQTRPHASAIESKWITVTEAARLLLDDVSGIELPKAKARVSKAASGEKFTTNGKQGQARRIDRESFSVWRLEQRERDLAAFD